MVSAIAEWIRALAEFCLGTSGALNRSVSVGVWALAGDGGYVLRNSDAERKGPRGEPGWKPDSLKARLQTGDSLN